MQSPLISFVVPVYGVREYLSVCLDSILDQPGCRVEVIAVDDASPDGSGALLDERAAADSRLTVIHLDHARGPGNARNVGLAHAAGDYVWFSDGDDSIADGALAAISEQLAHVQPDVLLIDYQEQYPGGRIKPSPSAQLLRHAPAGTFTLADVPAVINLSMTAWSKLFRREFLLDLDQPFLPGIHEDIPVTCAALLAGRIGVLDRVCYRYRRQRPESFMSITSSSHQAVFASYEQVLNRLEELAAARDPVATAAVRTAVFERAIWHYAAVLQAGRAGLAPSGRSGLVPPAERREFFARMHADFVRYRPPGYRYPAGARGAKLRLIGRGAFRTFEFLEPLNRLRVSSRPVGAMPRTAR